MVTTITRETSSGTYTHVIDIAGVTGALLWTLLSGTVLFMLAYSTNAWIRRDYDMGDLSSGLWQSCLCADIAGDDAAGKNHPINCIKGNSIALLTYIYHVISI